MELVKYHNDINKIRLGTLTEKELDIFITLIWRMQEEDTKTVKISFSELKDLSEVKARHNDRLINTIDKMSAKLVSLNQRIEMPNGDILRYNLFDKLLISPSKSTLEIKVTETFKYMLNNLLGSFTLYSLKEYISLNSKYSKQVFKILKQYQNLGCFHQLKQDDFKEILSVPSGYTTTDFNVKVLRPILKELSSIFNNLKIIKLDRNNKPVGRGKKTISIRFEWDKEIKEARKTLEYNIQAKEDKARLLADEKAKARIKKTEKLISEKKELSKLDRAKGKLIAQYSKEGKFQIITKISKLGSIEELMDFKKNINN